MNAAELIAFLENQGITAEQASAMLRRTGSDNLGFSVVDHSRGGRQYLPEVVFAQGKTTEQTVSIMEVLLDRSGLAIASRVSPQAAEALCVEFPSGVWHRMERLFIAGSCPEEKKVSGTAAVVTAGTSDLPVAGEAKLILETMGVTVSQFADVGVAGIHRLSSVLPDIMKCSLCICCAGMDAAIVSVLGGLFPGPVIAVPVSTGYGAALSGFTALLSSLSSCSPGVTVVNIDNGLGGAAAALRILGSACSGNNCKND